MDQDQLELIVKASQAAADHSGMAIMAGLIVTLFAGFSALLLGVLKLWRDAVQAQAKECAASHERLADEIRRLGDRGCG